MEKRKGKKLRPISGKVELTLEESSALPDTIWVSSAGGDYWVSSAGGDYWVSTT